MNNLSDEELLEGINNFYNDDIIHEAISILVTRSYQNKYIIDKGKFKSKNRRDIYLYHYVHQILINNDKSAVDILREIAKEHINILGILITLYSESGIQVAARINGELFLSLLSFMIDNDKYDYIFKELISTLHGMSRNDLVGPFINKNKDKYTRDELVETIFIDFSPNEDGVFEKNLDKYVANQILNYTDIKIEEIKIYAESKYSELLNDVNVWINEIILNQI